MGRLAYGVVVAVLVVCLVSQWEHSDGGSGVAAAESLYDILGVPSSAPMEVINKAFRKLAAVYHPDKNRDNQLWAQEQYIRVTQAFEVLINPHTRKSYDESGNTGAGGAAGGAPVQQNPGLQTSILRLDLEVLYSGRTLSLRVDTECLCEACGGTRVTGAAAAIGTGGGGEGEVEANGGLAHRHQFGDCPACQGTGKQACAITFNAAISRGCTEGARIAVPQSSRRTVVRQLVIIVYSSPHPHFRRVGDDLYYTLDISQFDADNGFKVSFRHLDNRAMWVTCHGGIEEGHVFFYKKEGMPVMGSNNRLGDLYVSVHIVDGVAELQDAFGGYYEWDIQGEDLPDNGELWPFFRRCFTRSLAPEAAMRFCSAAGIPWGPPCSKATTFLSCTPFSEKELRFVEEEWNRMEKR